MGRKVNVLTRTPVEGRSAWRGVLREVRTGRSPWPTVEHEVVIDLADVTKANLVYEFKQGRGDE